MSSMSGTQFNSKLRFVAGLVETLVPDYKHAQPNPVLASETGVGGCVAKSAISAIILEKAGFIGSNPAIAWNTNTHPKHGDDLLGRPKILSGHAYLLVSNTTNTSINAVSFNPDGVISSNWQIFDFNEEVKYTEINEENDITITEAGNTVGYQSYRWHRAGQLYMQALGITDSIYDTQSQEQITERVLANLKSRDLLDTF